MALELAGRFPTPALSADLVFLHSAAPQLTHLCRGLTVSALHGCWGIK